jgi:phospholipid transport system substrate-binding protein
MKKILLLAAIFTAVTTSAFSDEKKFGSKDAGKFVEEIGNNIVTIANEKAPEAKKKEKIMLVIDNAIDAEWIARFVLGKNYKTTSDAQKEEFSKLYRNFMVNTYGPKFKNYNGRKFTVKDVTEQSGFYVVKSEFLPRDSDVAISVDFRVKERNGKLVILDFIAEGVSLIETQRSEFNSAISQEGMDKFLETLRQRVKKLATQK